MKNYFKLPLRFKRQSKARFATVSKTEECFFLQGLECKNPNLICLRSVKGYIKLYGIAKTSLCYSAFVLIQDSLRRFNVTFSNLNAFYHKANT